MYIFAHIFLVYMHIVVNFTFFAKLGEDTYTLHHVLLSWKWQSATVCNRDKSMLTFRFGTPSFHNLFVMCVSLICLQRNNKNKFFSPAYIDFSRSRDCIMTNHIDRLHRSKGKEIVSSIPNKEKKEVSDGMKSDSMGGHHSLGFLWPREFT